MSDKFKIPREKFPNLENIDSQSKTRTITPSNIKLLNKYRPTAQTILTAQTIKATSIFFVELYKTPEMQRIINAINNNDAKVVVGILRAIASMIKSKNINKTVPAAAII